MESIFTKRIDVSNRAWIFQGDPKVYNVLGALNDPDIGNKIHWNVKQYEKFIKKGNNALIWLSGNFAGIYAVGEILTNPSWMKDTESEKNYWLTEMTDKEKDELKKQVIIKINSKYEYNPILKSQLEQISELKKLSIIKLPQGTNFKIESEEWKLIKELLDKQKSL